jgi:hypothetical protein
MKKFDEIYTRIDELKRSEVNGKAYFDACLSPMRFLLDVGVSVFDWEDLKLRRREIKDEELSIYKLLERHVMYILSNAERNMSYKMPKQLCSIYAPEFYDKKHQNSKEKEPIDLSDGENNSELEI